MISPIRLIVLFVVLFGLTSCGGRVSISAEEKMWALLIFWAVFTVHICMQAGRYRGLAKGRKAHVKDLQKRVSRLAGPAEPVQSFISEIDAILPISNDELAGDLYESYAACVSGSEKLERQKPLPWAALKESNPNELSAWLLVAAKAKEALA